MFAGMGHDTIVLGTGCNQLRQSRYGNDSICPAPLLPLFVVGGGLADTISFASGFNGGYIYDLVGSKVTMTVLTSSGTAAKHAILTNACGGGADTIAFSCQQETVVIEGGSHADRLVDEVLTITVDGGAGVDSIFLNSHQSAGGSVLGGLGNDSINLETGFGGGITVDGGAGADNRV